MSEIDTTILTDVRIYAQKLRDTLKNVVLQMQAEVKKRDTALTQEDHDAAQRFQDKLNASADEAETLVKELEPHVPTFLAQPYPEFANRNTQVRMDSGAGNAGNVAVEVNRPNADEEAPEERKAEPEANNVLVNNQNAGAEHADNGNFPEVEEATEHEDSEASKEAVEREEAAEEEEEDKTEQDKNSDNDDDLSPEARAIIEGFKRLTGGRPDPRMGWGMIPDRYK